MPRYIEQLNENTTPAIGDWLWIVDVDAGATDQDRKLSVGKLAMLATANVFTGPGSLLHLYSTSEAGEAKLKIQRTVVDSYPGIDFINDARSWNIAVDGSASDALVFYDSTDSQYRMVISTNGNVLVGTTTDVTSARLQVGGTTGALLLSRLSSSDIGALTPVPGMILYNTSTAKLQGYESAGVGWVNLI